MMENTRRVAVLELPAWLLIKLLSMPEETKILDLRKKDELSAEPVLEILVEHEKLKPVHDSCIVARTCPLFTEHKIAVFDNWGSAHDG